MEKNAARSKKKKKAGGLARYRHKGMEGYGKGWKAGGVMANESYPPASIAQKAIETGWMCYVW